MLLLVVLMLAAAAEVAVHLEHLAALRSRLLMIDPDHIPDQPALLGYALKLGKSGYQAHCVQCHGEQLHGDRARGVPDLVDHDWLYGSGRIGEIERIVMYGIRSGNSKAMNLASMPAFAHENPYPRYKVDPLTPSEVEDVSEFIYAFQHPQAVSPEQLARGGAIYHGKGICFDCHGDHAKGDPAVGTPNLTDDIWLYGEGSLPSIQAAIMQGLGGVCPEWIQQLSPVTMRSIAVYVHSRAVGALRG